MKQIKVDCCENCPYLEAFMSYYCSINGNKVIDKLTIHPECPLEDLEVNK